MFLFSCFPSPLPVFFSFVRSFTVDCRLSAFVRCAFRHLTSVLPPPPLPVCVPLITVPVHFPASPRPRVPLAPRVPLPLLCRLPSSSFVGPLTPIRPRPRTKWILDLLVSVVGWRVSSSPIESLGSYCLLSPNRGRPLLQRWL
ncbi:hypothetical protein K474DRAFT_761841 [Panus rudis PR-1116 ss-1]|nr:hypothetical protein K474DRAFT_761841 [Panus rudis PR-1116 ss-1]